ncbi:MAG TPA: hypothetical protein VL137_09940 [Polyangiaceae bacterium]|nr:hypothetical protein [Polyangiaceae bacterium]
MKLEGLASKLSDINQLGLTPALRERLGIANADVTRGRLMAQADDARSHLGVYLLAAFVVDDTDAWGDGEIYWWCIPAMVGADGQVRKNVLHHLPSGAAPHKVGSLEWMSNISLGEPPLLAVIPPDSDLKTCALRLGFYDDDGKPADIEAAMKSGLEAWAQLSDQSLPGQEQIFLPVRQAIWTALNAAEDDILLEQDWLMRKGESVPFGAGMIDSLINAKIRLYLLVRDEQHTEQFGPVQLHKGQSETVRFSQPMRSGGRLALFARGADVHCTSFGDLSADMPFQNRVILGSQEAQLQQGFSVVGNGPAKFIAFYTPPAL